MVVEPTLDQEAGRATVLKTACDLIQPVLACSCVCLASRNPGTKLRTALRRDPGLRAVRRQIRRQKTATGGQRRAQAARN